MDSIDDKEDMQFADEAFDILGFTKEEKYNVYKGGFQLLEFIIMELKSNVTSYNSMLLIG